MAAAAASEVMTGTTSNSTGRTPVAYLKLLARCSSLFTSNSLNLFPTTFSTFPSFSNASARHTQLDGTCEFHFQWVSELEVTVIRVA